MFLIRYMICEYFLPSHWLPFHFIDGFLLLCSFLVWYGSTCWFLLCCFVWKIEKKVTKTEVKTLLLMFSSRSFMFSGLTFKSFNSLWIAFCVWYKIVVQFHSRWLNSFPSTLLKRLSSLHWIFLVLCGKLIDCICVGYFCTLCSVLWVYVSVFMPTPCCFDYCDFVDFAVVWNQLAWCLLLYSSFQDALAIWSLLWFHTNVRIVHSISLKMPLESWIGIILNL